LATRLSRLSPWIEEFGIAIGDKYNPVASREMKAQTRVLMWMGAKMGFDWLATKQILPLMILD